MGDAGNEDRGTKFAGIRRSTLLLHVVPSIPAVPTPMPIRTKNRELKGQNRKFGVVDERFLRLVPLNFFRRGFLQPGKSALESWTSFQGRFCVSRFPKLYSVGVNRLNPLFKLFFKHRNTLFKECLVVISPYTERVEVSD